MPNSSSAKRTNLWSPELIDEEPKLSSSSSSFITATRLLTGSHLWRDGVREWRPFEALYLLLHHQNWMCVIAEEALI